MTDIALAPRRLALLLSLVLVLSAVTPSCSDEGFGPPPRAGSAGGEAEEEEPEPQTPEAIAVRAVLDQQVEAVRRGDGDAFAAPFLDDAFVFGPFAAHTLTQREALSTAITETFGQYLEPGRPAGIRRQGVRLGFAENRRAAWAFDVVSVVARGVETAFAASTLLVRDGSDWRIAAQVWAPQVEDDMAIDLAQAGQWPDPAPVDENVAEGTASIRTHVRAFVEGRETWPRGERRDSMMIGTAPGELTRGDEAIAAQVERAHAGGVRIERRGGVTTRRVGDGSVGFAVWTGALVLPRRPAPVRLPLRSFDVFIREGSGYRIVLKHVSLGAPGVAPGTSGTTETGSR